MTKLRKLNTITDVFSSLEKLGEHSDRGPNCRLVALGNDPLVAVAGPRLHHQLLPDYISAERWNTTSASFSVPDSVLEALQRRGHVVVPSDWGSVVQLITVDPDTSVLTAVSDPRKDGAPAGY